MWPHVTQEKPPAVGLPPVLRRNRFFFSSVTRSDSKCCTEAKHIARHNDPYPLLMSQVPSDRYCTPSRCASACPCISSAAHHGSVCHLQADSVVIGYGISKKVTQGHNWEHASPEIRELPQSLLRNHSQKRLDHDSAADASVSLPLPYPVTSGNIFRGYADADQSGECLRYRVTLCGRYHVKFGHRSSSSKQKP